jgi:hypothetical protein
MYDEDHISGGGGCVSFAGMSGTRSVLVGVSGCSVGGGGERLAKNLLSEGEDCGDPSSARDASGLSWYVSGRAWPSFGELCVLKLNGMRSEIERQVVVAPAAAATSWRSTATSRAARPLQTARLITFHFADGSPGAHVVNPGALG